MSDSTPTGKDPGASIHRPVLVRDVLQFLDLRPGLVVVDGTIGGGGHSRFILEQLGPDGKLIGLDRDPEMLARAARLITDSRATLKHASYAQLSQVLDSLGISQVDRVLLDLGLSSDQLADAMRGFGIQSGTRTGIAAGGQPLDMRFDPTEGPTASDLLATLSETELAGLFERFGEERASRPIARAIVARRSELAHWTAADLVGVVAGAAGRGQKRHPDIHPATRVFQALRIAVNHELEHLQQFLAGPLVDRLKPGGRAVVISFHSLEDRIVKDAFRDQALWQNLTPKPVTARSAEQRMNPRSRTAKLRAAMRKTESTRATGTSPRPRTTRP
ncbi:MAG TPA: 16S rRNA (cytosine(1402)-N(4))-methyltransferase RsmH [Planctomycetaceae bacterium]|nr:16S rRNA (cytosine(1402)-N(4))-methyltransferase RsmH [Planctomycetaceae bacterium]